MNKERLQKLAGITTESTVNEVKIFPREIMRQKYMYVGTILEFDKESDKIFDTLTDFYAEVMSGWDRGHKEAEKYLSSLSLERDTIVSNYSGKKTVELEKQ